MEGLVRVAMSPVMWTSRLSGMFPLDDQPGVSLPWALLSACLSATVLSSAVLFHSSINWHGRFSGLLFAGIAWILCLATDALVLLAFLQGPLYRQLLADLTNLEERLNNLGIKPKYSVQQIMADIGVRTTFLLATNIFNYNKMDSLVMFWSKTVAFYFTQWCISCMELHIVALATYLGDLFRSLRESLSGREAERHLEEAIRLQDSCKSFQRLFARQALIISSTLFLCTTLDLYFAMIVLREAPLKVLNHPSTYYRCGTRAYEFWRLASSVHSLTQQSKRFDEKLYTTALQEPYDELAKNEKILLYFSTKQEVKFLACGFFPIDFTLIFSVVAAVTNYLVILVQFGGNKINIPHMLLPKPHNTTRLQ